MLKFNEEDTKYIKKMLFQGWFHGMIEQQALKILHEAPELITEEEALQKALEFHLIVEKSFKTFQEEQAKPKSFAEIVGDTK